jgi:predicted nuclease of restriction endonuclease-like (RecB) superfamily
LSKLPLPDSLIGDLRQLIDGARQRVAQTVNHEVVLLYWHVGCRIHADVLGEQRAAYGKEVVQAVAAHLQPLYGRGFDKANLHRMVQMARLYPDEEKVVTLSRQLSWSHFLALLPLDDPLARDYYGEMCRVEGWSVRTLRDKINSMLYQRTALSRKPEQLIRNELDTLHAEERVTSALVFRDPYLLDFLELQDTFSERDLEMAILRELEAFILELGGGFTFVARQKRIVIDGEDFHIDLLFYHRDLCRLIAIELKLGRFKPADKGQVELYLRWLDKHERREGEASPLGLILCANRREEMIELLELEANGIHVAEYLTTLPPRELLEERLNRAIERARQQANLDGPAIDDEGNP